ncbi:MAG: hypothetical protein U0T36_03235 [Saprospiraceae bacterium]
MNNNSDNAVMLGNRDRVLYHYNVEVNGKIPTLTDLKQESGRRKSCRNSCHTNKS